MNVERREAVNRQDDYMNQPNLRVCAYCRVSTDNRDQKNSLEAQKVFFEEEFSIHANWINVGIYADEGISGTSLKKRDKFNEMIAKARAGQIDIILTKDVSRFSRNTEDLLTTVSELRAKSVYVYFFRDNIFTKEENYQYELTQLSQVAQSESFVTSNRVKWGQQRKMQQGVVFGRKEMFGYNIRRDDSGKQYFEIIEEEADVVRKIFEWFSQGIGTFRIAKKLEAQGIKTKRYKNGWSNVVILRILRNEKYVGDLLQGKTYTESMLDHKKKYNRGNSVSFYIENHHPESAIIDRDTWNKVQKILEEKEPTEEIKAKHSNRYWTSGKIFCGVCGGRYIGYNKKQKNGKYKAWVCFNNHKDGQAKQREINGEIFNIGCDGKRVNDRVLQMAIHDILKAFLPSFSAELRSQTLDAIKAPKQKSDNLTKIKKIEAELAEISENETKLTLKLVEGVITDFAYKSALSVYAEKQQSLNYQLQKLKHEDEERKNEQVEIERYLEIINRLLHLEDTDFNEELYESITKKIIVYPEQVLEFHLTCFPKPIKLQYTTKGRGQAYTANFTIL